MSDRTCPTCKKVFDRPSYLQRHRSRKTTCHAENQEIKCPYCDAKFTHYTNMRRHMRTRCDSKSNPAISNLIENLTSQNAQICAELSTLRQQIECTRAGPANVVNVQNNVALTQTLNINMFGHENTQHITPACIRAILDETLAMRIKLPEAARDAVTKTAMLIYSDPEHPENITAYIPNKKRSTEVRVRGPDGWELRPANLVMRPMTQTTIDLLFDKQPQYDNIERYGAILREIANSEERLTMGIEMRPILIRCKDLVLG